MAEIHEILNRLDKVKEMSPKGFAGRWMACCPAHGDKSPSLLISLTHEDMVLFHCYAGCGGEEVMNAIGGPTDWFYPPRDIQDDLKTHGFKSFYYSNKMIDELNAQVFYCAVGKSTMDAGGKVEGENLQKMRLCYKSLKEEYPKLKAGRYQEMCRRIECVFSWFGEAA